jgi:hypothetical protein
MLVPSRIVTHSLFFKVLCLKFFELNGQMNYINGKEVNNIYLFYSITLICLCKIIEED